MEMLQHIIRFVLLKREQLQSSQLTLLSVLPALMTRTFLQSKCIHLQKEQARFKLASITFPPSLPLKDWSFVLPLWISFAFQLGALSWELITPLAYSTQLCLKEFLFSGCSLPIRASTNMSWKHQPKPPVQRYRLTDLRKVMSSSCLA